MNSQCQLVVFSNRAYNAIIDETSRKNPLETGGILLGHVLDNGVWIVMEVIPPGINCIHEIAFFEYDEAFTNYLANSVITQYEIPLNLLGLWHRHPGSMDVFSGTDDGTNAKFASILPYGAISGLVNVDPRFRLTMRHVGYPLAYELVDYEVGDDIIPAQYLKLKHYPEKGLNPDLLGEGSDEQKKNCEKNIVPLSDGPSKKPEGETPRVDPVVSAKPVPTKKPWKKMVLGFALKALHWFLVAMGVIALLRFCTEQDLEPQKDAQKETVVAHKVQKKDSLVKVVKSKHDTVKSEKPVTKTKMQKGGKK